MSKDKISDYSATANSNTDIGGINIDEGCAPSGINDAIRTLMKQLKDWQSGSQDVYIHPAGSASVPSITATGDTNTGLFFPAADTIALTTGGTERLRLDSSGNLGLGVTPSAWTSGVKAIQFGLGANVFGSTSSYNNTNIVSNMYYNSGGAAIYQGSDYASFYQQVSGQHKWFNAASGTAGNAITFTQAMTLDASGTLQVGTTTSTGAITAASVLTTTKQFSMRDNTNNYVRKMGVDASNNWAFYSGDTEQMRIDSSGNLLVAGGISSLPWNATGNVGWGASINSTYGLTANNNNTLVGIFNRTNGVGGIVEFKYNGATVGSVSTNGTSASYNTSSDYRLKENIAPMTGALAKVAALKPCTYTWKLNGEVGEGFIAHELAEVVPQCVTGAKDAVDEEGNPKYQGIDTSFLVATLTAAIQEQQVIIQTLTSRIEALEQA